MLTHPDHCIPFTADSRPVRTVAAMAGTSTTTSTRRRAIAVAVATVASSVVAVVAGPSPAAAVEQPPTPELVGDINRLGLGSAPEGFVRLGDLILFRATTASTGAELWSLDLDTRKAALVADIAPGEADSNPSYLTVHDGLVLFAADDRVHGSELWVTDGTRGGTKMLDDIKAGAQSSSPRYLTPFEGEIYFSADDGSVGRELFRTDGSNVELAADVNPGATGSDVVPLASVPVDDSFDALYLRATVAGLGTEIARYDDKYGVTTFDLLPGTTGSSFSSSGVFDDSFFVSAGASAAEDLWRFTGADATTLTPVDLGVDGRALDIAANDVRMFVRTRSGIDDDLLVFDDPFAAPTTVLDDVSIQSLEPLRDGVIFQRTDDDGREPWYSGGTVGTTVQLADINPGADGSNPTSFTVDPASGIAVFGATGSDGEHLWRSDGTPGGTFRATPDGTHDVDKITVVDEKLFVFGNDDHGTTGREPWITAASSEDASLAADVNDANQSSNPGPFATVAGGVVFSANDGDGSQLFTSVPHGAAPQPIAGTLGMSLGRAVSLGDRAVFMTSDPTNGYEPWVTDGTEAGTLLIGNLAPGSLNADLDDTVGAGGTAFLISRDNGIWATGGVPGDLRQVYAGEVSSYAAADGRLFFDGESAEFGSEPYVSDGTVVGTNRLGDLDPGSSSSNPSGFVEFGGAVYFRAEGRLWRTDGAPGDVVEVSVPGDENTSVASVGAGSALLIWQESDGGATPSRLMTSADPMNGFDVVDLVGVGTDDLEIDADRAHRVDGATVVVISAGGRELDALLRVDGADASIVHQVGEGEYIDTFEIVEHLGYVYFVVEDEDGTYQRRLVQTDGTAPGTHEVDESETADFGITLRELSLVGGYLYYERSDAAIGTEAYRIDVGADAPTPPVGVSAVGEQQAATVSWSAPVDDGGQPIVSYTVTASPGGATCTTSSTACTVTGLTAGTSYTFTVRADNGRYVSPPSAASNAVVPTAPEQPEVPGFIPLSPARLLESRSGDGLSTVDGRFEGFGRVAAGSVTELVVAGRGGVPVGASAVSLNVTAVRPSGAGHLTVFPCGGAVPTASNVNYSAGVVVPNAVLSRVGVGGKVCIYSFAETHLIVDVNGAFESGFASLSPARLLESRSGDGLSTVDGRFEGFGRVAAGSVTELVVAGRGGVPVGASAVSLNVTAVRPSGAGHLTVFPCGGAVPTASNVNYSAGVVVPNAVLSRVGVGGKVCIYSFAETHLIVDVNGAFD